MNKGWAGWLGFIVLCGLIFVSSCQAWRADPTAPAGESESVKSE